MFPQLICWQSIAEKNKSSDFGATNTLCGSPLHKNKNKHKNNNVFVGKFVCLILFLNVISCFVFVSYFSKCFHN